MKYILILLVSVQIVMSQSGNGSASNMEHNFTLLNIVKPELAVNLVENDFNLDGYIETLKGEKIIKISNHEYWVKNTTLSTAEGDIISFGKDLKINNQEVTKQVQAKNGYIVIFEQGTSILEIYLADEHGSKDSDVFVINY